jgi:hypothetical protein
VPSVRPPRPPRLSRFPRSARWPRQALALAPGMALAILLLLPAAGAGAGGPPTAARALLQGHVRQGSWFAIAVDFENAGPTVTGELRVEAGTGSQTRFSTPVELATGSRKEYVLYALAPSFGGNLTVDLVDGDRVVSTAKVAVALHDQTQLVVGVVSDNPGRIVSGLDLLPGQNSGLQPVIIPLDPADLPDRVQAWSPLDRLIWQDVDTASLTAPQIAALRTWVAGGGRLVIVGGSAGADILTALPDDLLPYRPTSVLDIDPAVLRPMLGDLPAAAATLPAYAGELARGRALARSGDRVIAADQPYGAGFVTLLGFDPTTSWIADGDTLDAPLWRRLLPPRGTGTVALADDQTIVGALATMPSLALPPIGGLLVLLLGYIVLIGPVNYLLLRWLDRREWAWVTVPALIGVFTVGSFGIGGLLRGSDVILNEVSIVRGAPGTDQAIAQSYLGVFSPTRGTFQLRVPGDALLAAPMNGDFFGAGTGSLDVLEGDPSRVRNLDVGYGSMRTLRADASTRAPTVTADLRLEDGRIRGTITNQSDRPLVAPAIVLGSSVARFPDIAPGASVDVSMTISTNLVNESNLSDRVVGPYPFDGGPIDADAQRTIVRRAVIDQITYDPNMGYSGSMPGDSLTLLAWGTDPVVPAEIEGAAARRLSNVLYEIPLSVTIQGRATFRNDLLRSNAIEVDASWFNQDPWSISLGVGEVRMAYRPMAFEGTIDPESVVVALTQGGDITMPSGDPVALEEQARCDPAVASCPVQQDGLPDIEVLDVQTGDWVQFAHLQANRAYSLPDPARWVDPATGEVQVKWVNERQDGIGFQFGMILTGTVR